MFQSIDVCLSTLFSCHTFNEVRPKWMLTIKQRLLILKRIIIEVDIIKYYDILD